MGVLEWLGLIEPVDEPEEKPPDIRDDVRDALLQKTYTTDFMEKTRVKNNGIVPQYYVENCHDAIIPKDIFMRVQEEMIRRANLHSGANRKKRVYSSKYALSSLVYCSKCGEIYRRIAWNNRGKHSTVWRCCTRVEHGPSACDAETIKESDLQMVTVRAINKAVQASDSTLEVLKGILDTVVGSETEEELKSINAELAAQQQALLKATREKKPYDDIADAIEDLRDQKQRALIDKAEEEGRKLRIQEMTSFLSEMDRELTEYDEQMVRKYIARIIVFDNYYEVEFKAGIKVEVEK